MVIYIDSRKKIKTGVVKRSFFQRLLSADLQARAGLKHTCRWVASRRGLEERQAGAQHIALATTDVEPVERFRSGSCFATKTENHLDLTLEKEQVVFRKFLADWISDQLSIIAGVVVKRGGLFLRRLHGGLPSHRRRRVKLRPLRRENGRTADLRCRKRCKVDVPWLLRKYARHILRQVRLRPASPLKK